MTDPKFRVFARIVGGILLILGILAIWESWWISAGVNAFAREYGDAIGQAVDLAKWGELRPNSPPPDADRLIRSADGFFGARARRVGIVLFSVCELAGALLILASIQRHPRTGAA